MRRLVLLCLLIVLEAPPCLADDGAAETASSVSRGGLTVIDWGIIAAYAAATLSLGWYYSRKQKSTQEYFTGTGHMNWLLIGVSLFATLLSTISYLSMPGESLGKGPGFMASYLALPLVFFAVAYGLLPVYMKQRVTSAYELLEAKLGLSIRLLGAVMFIVLRLVWMSLLIYLTAKALSIMMGLSESAIPWIALATGFIAVIYTSLGGLRAVVITDFMQTVLLYGGALLVLGTITYDLGGFGWVPRQWNPNWDTQPIFSSDPSTRVTLIGAMLSYFVWNVCTSGGDQTSVQRFMSTSNLRSARRAVFTQYFVTAVVVITLGFTGFALLAYFEAHPERIPNKPLTKTEIAANTPPQQMTLKDDADKIFPYFIAYELPVGISGLVVAAMFAAAMSSIDSGVNSITAVVVTDLFDRFGRGPKTERGHVRLARWMAFGIGAFVVFCSSFMQHIPGNITAVTQKTSNLLTTPIFGLFFFALFVPFASPKGVWIGTICGTITAAVIAFSGPLVVFLSTQFGMDPTQFGVELMAKIHPETGREYFVSAIREINPNTGETYLDARDPISFQWIAPAAVAVNILTGSLGSLLFPAKARET
jgi:solute:Na+ symporter, SSS family